jgi:CSLREA domain-containing protein
MASLFRRFRKPPPPRPPARARLALEPLEERTVPATIFTVTTLADETNPVGPLSLREAIGDANLNAGADTINFQPGLSGTITLSLGQLQITDSVTITGPAAAVITISGNNASRIFFIDDRTTAVINVTISGLTLTHGNSGTENGGAILLPGNDALILSGMVIVGNSTGNEGGGVCISAPSSSSHTLLTLEDSTVNNNHAGKGGGGLVITGDDTVAQVRNSTISGNSAGDDGGGIECHYSSLRVEDSTISGNSAQGGGGIQVDQATLTLEDSTVSGNSVTGGAGGLFIGGDTIIRNSTIAFNTADSDNFDGTSGGGLFVFAGAVTLQSTIVADNIVGATGVHPDIDGTVTATFSLIKDIAGTSFGLGSTANIVGLDPRLGPLQFNGGPTKTHALLAGSPAIHHGASPSGMIFDQRGPGFARRAGIAADIGAFEVQAPLPTTDQALQAAVQLIRALQPAGAHLAAATFADLDGDFDTDLVLALRLRNGRLLLLTLDGADGHILSAFVPFPARLNTAAHVRLLTADLNGDGALEVALIISNGGPGVPPLSAFTAAGRRVL